MKLIPTTILTGFLGAGKTTLLKQILQGDHGHKIAVIENEFGEENIDHEILLHDDNERIIEMNNGCICCTVRGDLIMALSSLAQKRRDGALDFDHVVIETTGLANPGPVAQTFFMDEEVATQYLLDAVITVVDAKHAMQQLDLHDEAQRQVGFADKIMLSKTDLVSPAQVDGLSARLRRMNPRASFCTTSLGTAPLTELLDLRGFNLNDKLDIDPDFLRAQDHQAEHAHEHEHERAHEHSHEHEQAAEDGHVHGPDCGHAEHAPQHLDSIAAFVFRSERAFDSARLDHFLGSLVNVFGPRMLRYKGVLWMAGGERRVIFQGVHQTMGSDVGAKWEAGETRGSKIVFIGKDLPKDIFVAGLEQCLV